MKHNKLVTKPKRVLNKPGLAGEMKAKPIKKVEECDVLECQIRRDG